MTKLSPEEKLQIISLIEQKKKNLGSYSAVSKFLAKLQLPKLERINTTPMVMICG